MRISILFFLLCIPILAEAHGEEAIFTIGGFLVAVLANLAVITYIRAKRLVKISATVIYFIAVAAALYYIRDLSFAPNENRINIIVLLIPSLIGIGSVFLLRQIMQ